MVMTTAYNTVGQTCIIGDRCDYTNRITSIASDGFKIGDDDDVNRNGRLYFYIAAKSHAGAISIGSYSGNATSNRGVSSIGFQPAFMLTKPNSNDDMVFRPDVVTGDATLRITANTKSTGMIQSLDATGFTLGNAANANKASTTIYYAAFGGGGGLFPISR